MQRDKRQPRGRTQTRRVGDAAGGAERSRRGQGSRASGPSLRRVTSPAQATSGGRCCWLGKSRLQEAGKEMGGEKKRPKIEYSLKFRSKDKGKLRL